MKIDRRESVKNFLHLLTNLRTLLQSLLPRRFRSLNWKSMRYTLLVRKPDYHSTVAFPFSSKDNSSPPRYTPGACIYPLPRLTCIYIESSSNQMGSEPRLSIPVSSSPINSINFAIVTPIGRRHEKIDRKKRLESNFYNSI